MAKGVLLLLGRELLLGILQHRALMEPMLKVAGMRGDWKGVNEGAYHLAIDYRHLLSTMHDFERHSCWCFATAIVEHNSIYERKLYDAAQIRLQPWPFTHILTEFNLLLAELAEQTNVQVAASIEFPRLWNGVTSSCFNLFKIFSRVKKQ